MTYFKRFTFSVGTSGFGADYLFTGVVDNKKHIAKCQPYVFK